MVEAGIQQPCRQHGSSSSACRQAAGRRQAGKGPRQRQEAQAAQGQVCMVCVAAGRKAKLQHAKVQEPAGKVAVEGGGRQARGRCAA